MKLKTQFKRFYSWCQHQLAQLKQMHSDQSCGLNYSACTWNVCPHLVGAYFLLQSTPVLVMRSHRTVISPWKGRTQQFHIQSMKVISHSLHTSVLCLYSLLKSLTQSQSCFDIFSHLFSYYNADVMPPRNRSSFKLFFTSDSYNCCLLVLSFPHMQTQSVTISKSNGDISDSFHFTMNGADCKPWVKDQGCAITPPAN